MLTGAHTWWLGKLYILYLHGISMYESWMPESSMEGVNVVMSYKLQLLYHKGTCCLCICNVLIQWFSNYPQVADYVKIEEEARLHEDWGRSQVMWRLRKKPGYVKIEEEARLSEDWGRSQEEEGKNSKVTVLRLHYSWLLVTVKVAT